MCMFNAPKPAAPPPIPMKEDANQARLNELARRANQRGFASTISPGTLLGTSATNPNNPSSNAAPKSLLGV